MSQGDENDRYKNMKTASGKGSTGHIRHYDVELKDLNSKDMRRVLAEVFRLVANKKLGVYEDSKRSSCIDCLYIKGEEVDSLYARVDRFYETYMRELKENPNENN